MRKTLLLAALLVASVFTAKAQTEFSNSVEAYPNNDWTAAWVIYDMANVASELGYADATAFHDDLLSALVSNGSEGTLKIYNIDNFGSETLATGAANYYHTENNGETWENYTYGCFWLNENSVSVEWDNGNKFWSHVDWYLSDNELVIGLGQMAHENNNTGLAPGTSWTANTKLVHGDKYVILHSTLIIIAPPALPDPVTDLESLNVIEKYTVEVTQQIMTEWDSDGTKNPQWSVNGKALIEATGVDVAAVSSNMASIFFMRAWDNAGDVISNTLTANHTANGNGFWCSRTTDPETEQLTEYCVQGEYGSSDFFVENITFQQNDSTFHGGSGQMINRFKGGEHFFTDLYFIIGDQAIQVEFHFNVEKEAEIPIDEMVKVGETTMTWVQEPRTSTAGLKKFIPNYAEILELLGCNEAAIRYKLYQPDNTLDDGTNTENNGFWVDAAGYKTVIEEGKQAFYIDYAADVMALSVGQYPNVFAAGDEMLATVWLCNKEKYYQVNVMLHVQDLTKVETTEYHEVASYSYAVRSLIDGAWDATEKFIEGLPMAEIEEALGTNDFVVYAKQPGDIWSTGYTCTPYPGFWYTVDGNVVGWGEAHIGLRFERDYLVVHKNPQMTDWAVGNKYNHSIYLVNEVTGAYVTFNVQVTIVSEIVNYTDVGSKDVTVYVDPNVNDGWGMNEVEAADMFEALGIEPDYFWGGDVEVQLPIDDDMYASFDTDFTSFDYFFSADGKGVHADGTVYSFEVTLEQGADATTMAINANVSDFDPENLDGQERTTTIALIKGSKRYFLNVRMFYGLEDAITAVEAQQQKTGAVYTLAGQRVNAPVRGLYIQNGKKIFVK